MARVTLPSRWQDPGLIAAVLAPVDGQILDLSDLPATSLIRIRYWLTAMGCQWRAAGDGGILVTEEAEPLLPMPSVIAWAKVIMGYFPDAPAAEMARRRPHIQAQAASRSRAEIEGIPAAIRAPARQVDISIKRRNLPYSAYFAVEEIDFTHERFRGGHGNPVRRAVFVSGDAVTVLPYDPVRDRVLLVEQLRSGPLVRGDRNAWQLEAIAGRIDPGETPVGAALRETIEEAGLHLHQDRLRSIADYYPSPGTSAEKLYSYLALVDLPDGVAGIHGLENEDEDIRGHLVGFDQLMDLIQTGEISNAPTILSGLWLARERPGLRA